MNSLKQLLPMQFRVKYSRFSDRSSYHLLYCIGILIFAGVLMLSGCDTTNTEEQGPPNVVDAIILFEGASTDLPSIEVGETIKFEGFAITETRDRIPLADLGANWEWDWYSTEPAVATLDTEGHVTGQGEGKAFCVLELFTTDDVQSTLSNVAVDFKNRIAPKIIIITTDCLGVKVLAPASVAGGGKPVKLGLH